ncbi:MAG TPA: hypothetical protein PKJ94_11885, partial [Ferruginibacter sp.]|nr:hypothetical protein [Ferruginibacter sp.]
MQQPNQKKITLAFIVLTLMDITGILTGSERLHFIAKPLLVPALLLLMFVTQNGVKGKTLVM